MKEIFVRWYRCMGCRSCETACAVEHSNSKSLFGAIGEIPRPVKRLYVEQAEGFKVPLVCRHCDDAPCVAVCRTGAMAQDARSLVVTRELERCVECWMCAMACPYGVIGHLGGTRKAVKCDRCPDQEVPACVKACPTGTLLFMEEGEFSEIMRRDAASKRATGRRGTA